MASFQAGQVLGDRFEVVGVLGMGGVATVYLAVDRLRGESIALKVLHGHLAHSASWRSRLRREVNAASRLRHPHALVAAELHELDGILAVSMPLHPGTTLADRVDRRGALTCAELERIGRQLAGALQEAHRAGILHRDVTSANVMIDEAGNAVLTDFGLARFADQRTATGTGVLGTAGFAAPEVYRGHRDDPRSDLYSLGAVLYQAATGSLPFPAPDPMGVLERQVCDDRLPLGIARPDLPSRLARMIDGLLASNPDLRPQTASEVLAALDGKALPAPVAETLPQVAVARAGVPEPRAHLAPGHWTVIVSERRKDRVRRRALRWSALQTQARIPEDTAEHRLADAIAQEARLPPGAVAVPRGMLALKFRLVEAVSEDLAHRFAQIALEEGFDALPWRLDAPLPKATDSIRLLGLALLILGMPLGIVPLASMYMGLPLVGQDLVTMAPTLAIAALFAVIAVAVRPAPKSPGDGFDFLPIAYGRDLRFHVAPALARLLPTPPDTREAPVEDAPSRPQSPLRLPAPRHESVAERARVQLGAFAEALTAQSDQLPEAARRDLGATLRDLRARVDALGPRLLGLERELRSLDDATAAAAVDRIEARIERLRTLARSGRADEAAEIPDLEHALAVHRGVLDRAERLDAQITLAVARLLEAGATAAHARAALIDAPEAPCSFGDLLERLRGQTEDVRLALAELEPARAQVV